MPEASESQPPLHIRLGRRIKKRWRAWLRAFHRDVGYLAVGLTFVYAISGIAINHIDDWNPNFDTISRTHQIEAPLPEDEKAATEVILRELGIDKEPVSTYLAGGELEIELPGQNHLLRAELASGTVYEDAEEPRFFLRVANWLHYNRGKAAWTYVADGYAFLLLFLATSGLFMLRGRKGLIGRGAILVILGAAVPILYVHWSGGP